jgi:hypothetical protein
VFLLAPRFFFVNFLERRCSTIVAFRPLELH